ncbi:hypothetical protein [Streptomyces sp. NPDC005438]|uniref:hypothetical protein n=1 Tax=Streptomyces sp. NPDC005438 TaxID=3156880 RepID=UPI0033BC17A6
MSTPIALATRGSELVRLAEELDKNKVTPGVLGFLVFAALGAAVWMLMKSMNRHMQRVDFDEEDPAAGTRRSDGGTARREEAEAGTSTGVTGSRDDDTT